MLSDLLKETVQYYELQQGDKVQTYPDEPTSSPKVYITNLQMEDVLEADGRFSKTKTMYSLSSAGMKREGKIVRSNGEVYIIKDPNHYSQGGISFTKYIIDVLRKDA